MNKHAVIGSVIGGIVALGAEATDAREMPYYLLLWATGVDNPIGCVQWIEHPNPILNLLRPCAPFASAGEIKFISILLLFIALVLIGCGIVTLLGKIAKEQGRS